MENSSFKISDLTEHLFWDVDRESLDWEEHKKFIVHRVLEYGMESDWQILNKIYGIHTIRDIAITICSLDEISSNYISKITQTPIESFQCFIQKQSIPHYSGF